MTFKTKEEMFGDGAGFGAAVPYSTTNPAGTSSGNRGIQFGEALTAAIANRTHYALALNDEDLDERIAIFETSGLDAAYDLGEAAVPGGGAVINKDAGAVEVVSAHGAITGDTEYDAALLRARAMSDTVGVAIGFDFVGGRVGTDAQSGNDPVAGFLDRRVFAQSSGNTVLTRTQSGILNPASAGATILRTAAGKFHTSSVTDLLPYLDLVEITSAGTFKGLYILGLPTGANTDIILSRLDGTAPTFTADTAVTFTVFRVRFGSMGAQSGRSSSNLEAVTMVGDISSNAVLDLVPGGASYVMRFLKDGTSTDRELVTVDKYGRFVANVTRSDLPTDVEKNAKGASPVFAHTIGTAEHGSSFASRATVLSATQAAFSAFALRTSLAHAPDVGPTFTVGFNANSAVTGELLIAAAPSTWPWILTPIGSVLELAGTYEGTYIIYKNDATGSNKVWVKRLDGAVPTHLPSSGTATASWYSFNGIGYLPSTAFDFQRGVTADTVRANNILSGGTEADTAALITVVHPGGLYMASEMGSDDGYHILCLRPSPESAAKTPRAMAYVRNDGHIWGVSLEASNDLTVGGDAAVTGTVAALDVEATTVTAGAVMFDPAISMPNRAIPLTLWYDVGTSVAGDSAWQLLATQNGSYDLSTLKWSKGLVATDDGRSQLWIPMQPTIPGGAVVSSVTLTYDWDSSAGDLYMVFVSVNSSGVVIDVDEVALISTNPGGPDTSHTTSITGLAYTLSDDSGFTQYVVVQPRAATGGVVSVTSCLVDFTLDGYYGS